MYRSALPPGGKTPTVCICKRDPVFPYLESSSFSSKWDADLNSVVVVMDPVTTVTCHALGDVAPPHCHLQILLTDWGHHQGGQQPGQSPDNICSIQTALSWRIKQRYRAVRKYLDSNSNSAAADNFLKTTIDFTA